MEDYSKNSSHPKIQMTKKRSHFLLPFHSRLIKQQKALLVIGAILTGMMMVGGYAWHENFFVSTTIHKKNGNDHRQLVQQLNEVAIKMAAIEHHLATDPLIYIEKIQLDLAKLKERTEQVALESRQVISHQIEQATLDLNQHLTVLTARLEKLEKEKTQAVYLFPSSLPFEIQHIDTIQQSTIVTVYYDNTTFPLEVGDYLAGWKLISVDFTEQKAEFINQKRQHVVVDLNHLNEKKR
jgi:hypothetical protein